MPQDFASAELSSDAVPDILPKAAQPIFAGDAPRASSFIVTIYGDVVEPRGGSMWMGTLIACCACHGISESLVRTAVSRLVASGRLEGQRIGRKSYYRLSQDGQAEFRRAARILFAPPPPPQDWLIALGADEGALPFGWVSVAGAAAISPDQGGSTMPDGPVLRAQAIAGIDDLPDFAARHWPVDEVAQIYRRFVARFAPVWDERLAEGLTDSTSLALRLRLVDEYRHAALADPRLPVQALPRDWPADAARGIFRRIYLALSPAADRHVGRNFADSDGLLAETTDQTGIRLTELRRK